MRRAIEEVVAGPEVRAAMAKQTTGLAEELVVGVRSRAVLFDDRIERRSRTAPSPFAGIATRAVALGIDAGLILVAFASLAALAGADRCAGRRATPCLAGGSPARRRMDGAWRRATSSCSGAERDRHPACVSFASACARARGTRRPWADRSCAPWER